MFEKIDYQRLRRLLDQGAQLVEVLPAQEYAEEHLPAAINIPLKQLDAYSTAQLNKGQAGDRLLLGLPLRHEPEGGGAARRTRLRGGL